MGKEQDQEQKKEEEQVTELRRIKRKTGLNCGVIAAELQTNRKYVVASAHAQST